MKPYGNEHSHKGHDQLKCGRALRRSYRKTTRQQSKAELRDMLVEAAS